MRWALALAAIGESATGLALLIVPSSMGEWLLAEPLTGVAVTVARVAGLALFALGVACGPGGPLLGMLVYSASATVYLAAVALAGGSNGPLLWPAVLLHLVLTVLLARAQFAARGRSCRRAGR